VLEAEAADGTMLRAFGAGDVHNESGLFERRPSPADITVRERGALLRLDRSGLEACLTGNPDPRHFLSLLRDQAVDRDLATMLGKLGKL
jgi:CRP-like cAMP-binding protein